MTYHYTVLLERESDGGYHASCPALPGCHSQGDTLDDAVANIKEAIALYIESLAAHDEPLPVEDILIKPVDVVTTRARCPLSVPASLPALLKRSASSSIGSAAVTPSTFAPPINDALSSPCMPALTSNPKHCMRSS